MRAVVISEPGGPDVLKLAEVPDPVPAPGEVLVDVTGAGVNRADLMQRQGLYPAPPGAPPYPGLECSGRIAGLGPGTDGWQVGDEVCALLGGGGYAEKVAVPAGQLLPVPAGVPLTDAAGLPEVACTAGSPAKLDRCRERGADLAIDSTTDDFVEAVRDFTGGRLVVIGLQGGGRGELDLGVLLRKRASVQAATLRSRPTAEKAAIVTAVREQVWPLISAGQVTAVIDRVLPLADAPEAHRLMEAGAHVGKILLAV